MRHAGSATSDALEPLLIALRRLPGLREKNRGVFYAKSRAFLHFHEDPAGLFGDLRNPQTGDFDRYDVSDAEGRARLLAEAAARTA